MKKGVSAGGVAGDPSLSQSSPPPSQGSCGGRPLLPHEACAAMVSVWLLQEAQGEGGLWEGQGLKQGLLAHHKWDQHSPPWPRRNPALPTTAPDPERWRTVLSWTSQAQLPMLGPLTGSFLSLQGDSLRLCDRCHHTTVLTLSSTVPLGSGVICHRAPFENPQPRTLLVAAALVTEWTAGLPEAGFHSTRS